MENKKDTDEVISECDECGCECECAAGGPEQDCATEEGGCGCGCSLKGNVWEGYEE